MTAPFAPDARRRWLAVRPALQGIRADGSAAGSFALASLVALSLVLLLLRGDPVIAAAPIAACAVGLVLWRTSMRRLLLCLSFVALAVSMQPRLRGVSVTWRTVFFPIFAFLSENLNKTTGIEALRFSGLEAIYLLVIGLFFLRRLFADTIDDRSRVPVASLLLPVLVAAGLTVLWLELRGMARSGDFRQSLWQFRGVLWLSVMSALFAWCLRGARDFRTVATMITSAAAIKVVVGVLYLSRYVWPQGYVVEQMSSHDDSILFTAVTVLWASHWMHQPSRRSLWQMILFGGLGLLAIAINGRRLAYVELATCLLLVYLLLDGPMKRRISRGLAVLLPLLVVYVVLGSNGTGALFAPAQAIMSVFRQNDSSSITRDIENFNLIVTLHDHPLLGSGWGHMYNELVKADDISAAFAQYRFIGHNSILWLLSIGGIVGFYLLWLPVVVAVYLAARSYRAARTPHIRIAAMHIMCVLLCFVQQAWGDMGTQGMFSAGLVALSIGLAAQLAVETGAWPASGPRMSADRSVAPPARRDGVVPPPVRVPA